MDVELGPLRKEEEICGSCRWIMGLREWDLRYLRQAADSGLSTLVRETVSLLRKKFWCRWGRCWVHISDRACSLHEPGEEGDAP